MGRTPNVAAGSRRPPFPPIPSRAALQLWAVGFTLVVSLSGVALELLGGSLTPVGMVLGGRGGGARPRPAERPRTGPLPLVAPFPLAVRADPSPLTHHLVWLGALTLPALYLPCFAEETVARALVRAGSVLGLFLLLAVPHAFAMAPGGDRSTALCFCSSSPKRTA